MIIYWWKLNGDARDTCFNCFTKLNNTSTSSSTTNSISTSNTTDIIVTKSDTIDNYSISRYLGTVSGTDIYLVGGLIGGGLANQEGLFRAAYEIAENRMVSKAKAMGANAIISVQTNMCSPGNLNNIIVVAQGTAVYIEKEH